MFEGRVYLHLKPNSVAELTQRLDAVDKIAGVKKITENLSNTAEELERRFAHDLSVTAISSCRTESKSEVRVCVSSGKN
jgi:hypothetical protein